MAKKCVCEGCDNNAGHMLKRMCPYHYGESKKKKDYSKFRRYPKKRDQGLDKFFKDAIELNSTFPYSYESGEYVRKVGRVNIAHIMPKSVFPSVATDPTNYVFLTWTEHSTFDAFLEMGKIDEIKKRLPKTFAYMQEVLPELLEKCDEKNKKRYQFYVSITELKS